MNESDDEDEGGGDAGSVKSGGGGGMSEDEGSLTDESNSIIRCVSGPDILDPDCRLPSSESQNPDLKSCSNVTLAFAAVHRRRHGRNGNASEA